MRKTINGIQVPQRADFVGSFLRPADLSSGNRDERVAQLIYAYHRRRIQQNILAPRFFLGTGCHSSRKGR